MAKAETKKAAAPASKDSGSKGGMVEAVVLSRLRHDGKLYVKGDSVTLKKETFERLRGHKAVKAAGEADPEAPKKPLATGGASDDSDSGDEKDKKPEDDEDSDEGGE